MPPFLVLNSVYLENCCVLTRPFSICLALVILDCPNIFLDGNSKPSRNQAHTQHLQRRDENREAAGDAGLLHIAAYPALASLTLIDYCMDEQSREGSVLCITAMRNRRFLSRCAM
jgi:hypothetical protein